MASGTTGGGSVGGTDFAKDLLVAHLDGGGRSVGRGSDRASFELADLWRRWRRRSDVAAALLVGLESGWGWNGGADCWVEFA